MNKDEKTPPYVRNMDSADIALGKKAKWKEDADRVFTRDDVILLWDEILDNFPQQSEPIVFVSACSNYPTHEIAIHNHQQQKGKIITLAGDIGHVATIETIDNELAESENGSMFRFFRWDAEHLPIGLEKVTILLDRRGWLWQQSCNHFYYLKFVKIMRESLTSHTFQQQTELEKKLRDEVLQTFETYHSLLTNDGILVLDADNGKDDGYEEGSTLNMLQLFFRGYFLRNAKILSLFKIHFIGYGKSRSIVLQKK